MDPLPLPLNKPIFCTIIEAIQSLTSFVIAPLGFPASLRDMESLATFQQRNERMFQDILDLVSDILYENVFHVTKNWIW